MLWNWHRFARNDSSQTITTNIVNKTNTVFSEALDVKNTTL